MPPQEGWAGTTLPPSREAAVKRDWAGPGKAAAGLSAHGPHLVSFRAQSPPPGAGSGRVAGYRGLTGGPAGWVGAGAHTVGERSDFACGEGPGDGRRVGRVGSWVRKRVSNGVALKAGMPSAASVSIAGAGAEAILIAGVPTPHAGDTSHSHLQLSLLPRLRQGPCRRSGFLTGDGACTRIHLGRLWVLVLAHTTYRGPRLTHRLPFWGFTYPAAPTFWSLLLVHGQEVSPSLTRPHDACRSAHFIREGFYHLTSSQEQG